jgi:hypothetical protein
MKNLIPYRDDCFAVHKLAVDKKHPSELKSRLLLLNGEVEKEYKVFKEKFEINKLNVLVPNSTLLLSKDDLFTLYNYQNSVMKAFRETLRKLQIRTVITTCQNCTIDTANTFDHILPKAKYPEFVVNPINLLPCCSICNSYKLDSFGNNTTTKQKFLNLYLDELPTLQYLFVDVFLDPSNDIDFKFELRNVDNQIDAETFELLSSHYFNLRLFERMKFKSIEYISEMENRIFSFSKRLSIEDIIFDLIESANSDKMAYGNNHWKCVLEIALLESTDFIEKVKKGF